MDNAPGSGQSFNLTKSSLLVIAPFFLWGTAMVAMKGSIDQTTPLFLASLRLLPAGVLVLVAAGLMGRPQPAGWRAWLWISLFAFVDGTLFQGFLAEGLQRTGAGLGSVMIDSQPLAVAIMARFLFGEVVGLFGWLGLGFGISGISLLGLSDIWEQNMLAGQPMQFAPGSISIAGFFQQGTGLMLMAALSMAVGTVLIRYVCRHADPISATGWHMILGGIPLLIQSGLTESEQWQHLAIGDWGAIAYSTVFGSAIAYGIFFYLASIGNLTSLSALTFLTPVFALVFGNLFLGEVLSPIQWFGVGLTLISIYLVNQRQILAQKIGRSMPETLDAAPTMAASQPETDSRSA
ncbi:MAG: EamA family transporter [Cyanobacteria bacterium P01_H01_bin.119]